MNDIIESAKQLHDYDGVRDFLYSLRYHGAKYGLDRMRHFSKLLGDPQHRIPTIHVAGTNGKGSTCAMLERIFRDQGRTTGLYTSPHLIRQGERIQVNRTILPESAIVRYTQEMVKVLLDDATPSEQWPSFFEFMTAMGFLCFAETPVDVAVIETGLGGRLDATNILQPDLTVITSISLDHTQILGDTLERIAAEKAGILKPGIPVILGDLPAVAEEVIRERASECNATVYSIRDRFGRDLATYPQSNLVGEYQRRNAAMATLACEVLQQNEMGRYALDLSQIPLSLQQVNWPGRWETVSLRLRPALQMILDATHNEEGARMLELNLQRLIEETGHKPVMVVGSLGEDRARSLMDVVTRFADEIYLLQPSQPRALGFEQLRACVPSDYRGSIQDATVDALFSCEQCTIPTKPGQALVVTGSIYLIGEVSDRIHSKPLVNQQKLQDVV